ncbi:Flavoprotein family protein [Operophtera brumata]|uniref:Flavoprotein family protein n=1 Tax=Operophtera brumata TaxID=104452 RepID=A0A0L7LTY7_OPEBR|nr:Flavoprotein family protein [Operophtera brumata]
MEKRSVTDTTNTVLEDTNSSARAIATVVSSACSVAEEIEDKMSLNAPGGQVSTQIAEPYIEGVSKQHTTMADLLSNDLEWKKPKLSDEWVQVQRKRLRNRFVGQLGKAHNETGRFKAAETKVPVFISNVHKENTENDIIEYIRLKTNETVTWLKLGVTK